MDDEGWCLLPLSGFNRAQKYHEMVKTDLNALQEILLHALFEPDTDVRFVFLCRLKHAVMSVPDVSEDVADAIAAIRGGRNRDIQLTIDRIQAIQDAAAADAFLDTMLGD